MTCCHICLRKRCAKHRRPKLERQMVRAFTSDVLKAVLQWGPLGVICLGMAWFILHLTKRQDVKDEKHQEAMDRKDTLFVAALG